MVHAHAYVCVHTRGVSIEKTAELSQQGRVWQSADRLSRTLIINPSRSELPRKPTFISQKFRL